MEMILGVFTQALAPVFGTLLTSLASWGMFEVTRFVRQRTQSDRAATALAQIGGIVDTVVMELMQTMLDTLTRSTLDGKLDKADAEYIKSTALLKINQQIPAATAQAASAAVNSLSEWINSRLEQAVYTSKAPRIEGLALPLEPAK